MKTNRSLKLFKLSALARCLAIGVLLVAAARVVSANLIKNGDFETGDLTGWTVTGASSAGDIGVAKGLGPDTTFGAFFSAPGPQSSDISQSFTTTPGASYTLTFFYQVNNTSVPANNFFNVLWNGVSIGGGLFPQSNVNPGSIMPTFHLTATGTSTTLEFDGFNAPASDFLDNVSVTAAAAPDSGSTIGLLALALAGLFGTSRLRSLRLA
jgi:hypothetical protein